MKAYTNTTRQTIRFATNGSDYVIGPGQTVVLPSDNAHVLALEAKGQIVTETVEPSAAPAPEPIEPDAPAVEPVLVDDGKTKKTPPAKPAVDDDTTK